MITVRRSEDRGHANHGWLDARHTFSFASYMDRHHMGFCALRVINQDRVQPARGFGWHPHEDMEIVTVVLEGALEHKDSMNNGEVLRPGEVQRMSAGTGIFHSEFNHSKTDDVHLMQIWIQPAKKGIEPSYEQRDFPEAEKRNRLRLIVSPEAADGSLSINQDARLYESLLDVGTTVRHDIAPGRHAWVQVLGGAIDVNGTRLASGDGAAVSDEAALSITGADTGARFLLFDLN